MNNEKQGPSTSASDIRWDHGAHAGFLEYYAQQSQAPATRAHFVRVCEMLLRLWNASGRSGRVDVLDLGCGAGAQAAIWTERGHHYHGLDVNGPLIELARQRAKDAGVAAEFEIGSATALPWPANKFDICLMPELLEHVADWRTCVLEAARVTRPGGIVYIATSSKLCPIQREFNLPLYSWYPAPLKRYFERRAVGDWPGLVNYATYPAVNWFSYYGLRAHLSGLGFACLDRFDALDRCQLAPARRALLQTLTSSRGLRFLGHVLTPYTLVIAIKKTAMHMDGSS